MISGALKLATQKPTDATKKATGKQPIATPKPPLADTIQSLLGSTGPVQGPVENPIRQTVRKAEEFKVRQAKSADQKKKWAQNNPLTINSPFGEVKFTMDPEIADQYRNGDTQTKIDILNQYNQRVIEEGVRLGKSPLPQFRNTDIGKAMAGRFSTGMENIPQDERFRYEPYTPGDVITEAGRFAGNALTMMPGTLFNARATNPEVFEPVSVAAGMAAQDAFKLGKRVAPDYNLFGSISVNELLNPVGQGLQAVSDITNPEAGFGTTAGALTGVVASLTPGLEGAGVIVNALRAGKKFAPALIEGLITAGREGVIGWNTIERKIRAKDIANILEKAGTFNEAGYFLRQTERADFIRRLQEDAKAWARKNSKNENEFLEMQDEFYKNLIRPVLNNYPPTGVGATGTLSRGATADFQPAISGPARMSTRAGELAIPEAERYQQIIPSAPMDDDAIENLAMDTWQRMVANGASEQDATQMATQIAKTLKDDAKKPVTVYHGTTTEFEGAPSVGMSRTGAIHVTPNRAFAEQFTDINQSRAIGETPTVKEFSLDPSKVADLRQPDIKQDFIDFVVKKYGMKKPDPFDDEWEVINTGVFDPEGFRGNSKGISVDDLSDDIDQGAYWVAESKAAKDWAQSKGYAGVKAIEGESGHGVETFAIFDPKALGMETPKPTFIDNLDTKIAQLEQETRGRIYSGIGIDPSKVQLYALKAFRELYRGGIQAYVAIKTVLGKEADNKDLYKAVSTQLGKYLNENKVELIARKATTLSIQPENAKTDIADLVQLAITESGLKVSGEVQKRMVEAASKMYAENAYTRPFSKLGPDKYKVSAEDLTQAAFKAEDGKTYVRLHPGYDTLNGGIYTTLGGREITLLGGSDYALFNEMYGTVATSNKGKGSATALLKETRETPLILISLLKSDNLLNSPLGSSLFFEDMQDLIGGLVKDTNGKTIKITEQEVVTTLQKLFEGIGEKKWLKKRGPGGKLVSVDANKLTTLQDWRDLVASSFDNGAAFKEQLLKSQKRAKKALEPGARPEVFIRPAEDIIDMAANPEQRFSAPGTVVSAIAVDPIVGDAKYFNIPDHVSYAHVQAGLGLGDTNHVSLIDLFPEEWQKYKGMAASRYKNYLDATDEEKAAFDKAIKAAKDDGEDLVVAAENIEDETGKGIIIDNRPTAETVKANKLSVEQVKEAWGMQNSSPQPAHFITKVQKGNDKFELTERAIELLTGKRNPATDLLPSNVNLEGTINVEPGVGGKVRTAEPMGGRIRGKQIGRTPEQIAEIEQKNLTRTAQVEQKLARSEVRFSEGKQAREITKSAEQKLKSALKNPEKNRERITELEGLIQSKTKSLGGNRQRGAYVPPTKEELELLARRALNMVYTGGEKIADVVKSLAKGFGMPEGQENVIFDAIRKIDPEAVKDIPTTATTEAATEAATKTPDLIATANRITADVRRSVGLDDVNKVSPEQIADWEEEARKINTEKLMDEMLVSNKLRPLTKSEELAMGARLSRALERYDAAQKIIEDADFVTTDMLDRAQSAREEILKISDFTNAVGAEWGRAGVARQALIRADYTTAGVISKIKKAEVAASKAGTKEVRASAQQIADAEEFAKQSREKDAKIAELEKKIEDLRAQGAKEAPKRRIEARRKRLESEADDILAQIFQTRNRPSPGIKQGPEKGAVSIDVEKNVELMNLYGKLAKNFIQRGALNIEDVYTSVSEIAKQAGHAITKQGLIDALDQQMVKRRTKKVRGATKAEILQRQKLNRKIAKGSTRGQEAVAKAVAEKEVIRKAREEALALKKAENEAKRQAIRAEKQAANAQAKAEADAYRAEAKAQREEARRLAAEQRKLERQAKIDARQSRREELNQALGPIARDERKIANLKGRIEDYNRMIETGEFFASRPLKEGDEGYELTHLQEQVDLLRYEAKMAKMNVDGIIDDISQPKWVKVMKEVVGLPRYFQLGLDAGALTRQGFDIALVSPKAWTKAAKAGFGAAISNPAKMAKMEEEFMRSPEVLKAIANGLAIDGPSEFPEGFVSKIAAKVPGYGRGERFHKTFQNFARFEAYKNLTRNQNLNQYQLKEVAKLINAMTGRGSWKGAEGPLASIFTAPKMYAGQLEVMGKTAIAAVDPRFRTNPAYRKLIVRRWLGRMGGLVALKTLADATDWEFSINPDDSDFLKLRNGNTVIDVTGGYSSWYKLLFGTLNMIADTGMNPSLEKDLIRVLGYKVSPSARAPLSLITGKDAVGNPFFVNPDTKEREVNVKDLAKTFAPLIGVQIYEMAGGDEEYQDMDLGAKIGLGALGFVGTGVSKYPARESRRPVEETKWGQLLDQIGVQPR